MPWQRWRHVPLLLVLGVSGAAYVQNLGNPFFGSDTWPWLVSTRIGNAGDLWRVAFSPIMSGTNFVAEVAHFYHPLTALSYSLDQALFGLNPFAFYATNLLIHLCATGALYSLARGLGASWWAATACALMLGLHPVAAATVPSLPRRQDLVVGALFIGSMSLLARLSVGSAKPGWGWLAGAMVLFWLALGGKEIAYAGLAVVPCVLACSWPRTSPPHTPYPGAIQRAALSVAAFLVLEGFAFGVRWLVLGGLGGYNGSAASLGSTPGLVEFFLRPYVNGVLWPFSAAMPERLRDWLLVLGGGAVVVGAATAGFRRSHRLLVLTGLAWQAAFLLLYAVVHTSLSPYLLYVPLAGLALLVCGLLEGGVEAVHQQKCVRPPALFFRGCAIAAAAGSALLVVGVVRSSALFTNYPEFRDAGSASAQFVEQALPCLASAPAGTAVSVEGLPHRIDYASPESTFVDAYVFEAYSLESVVRLLAPETQAQIEVRSIADVTARTPNVAVSCSASDAGLRLVASVR